MITQSINQQINWLIRRSINQLTNKLIIHSLIQHLPSVPDVWSYAGGVPGVAVFTFILIQSKSSVASLTQLHQSSSKSQPTEEKKNSLFKLPKKKKSLFKFSQRHICHISNAVFLPQRVHWTIYTQHVYDFTVKLATFVFVLTFQEFHIIIQHRHQKFNDFLDRASTVLTRQRLVTSILGLGSMGNVCYGKIKLSSTG